MNGRSAKPPWMLFVVPPPSALDATYSAADLTFRIELDSTSLGDAREKRATALVFSTGAGAYVNCVDGRHLRGHGSKPDNKRPAGREPSTVLEVFTLSAAQAERVEPAEDAAAEEAPPPPPRGGARPAKTKKPPRKRASLASRFFGDGDAPPDGREPRDCAKACGGDGVDASGGFPPVAFPPPHDDYLCPSNFRDASDWVFAWPWSHFGEDAWVASGSAAARCLGDVPLVYAHANKVERAAAWATKELRRPFILISGQSDFAASKYRKVLKNGLLHRWYAQNNDLKNDGKVRALPIGLNCFEQAPEMHRALKAIGAAKHRAGGRVGDEAGDHAKRVWVNFGNTHAKRKVAWEHLCGDAKKKKKGKDWATCAVKTTKNNVKNNPHLVKYYQQVAAHRYVAAPRGNGLDTHRFWEALYLGCVPIVETGPLDHLYARVGALVVKSWTDVTAALLDAKHGELYARLKNHSHLLSAAHWRSTIEADRAAALAGGDRDRKRCWGTKK